MFQKIRHVITLLIIKKEELVLSVSVEPKQSPMAWGRGWEVL